MRYEADVRDVSILHKHCHKETLYIDGKDQYQRKVFSGSQRYYVYSELLNMI